MVASEGGPENDGTVLVVRFLALEPRIWYFMGFEKIVGPYTEVTSPHLKMHRISSPQAYVTKRISIYNSPPCVVEIADGSHTAVVDTL